MDWLYIADFKGKKIQTMNFGLNFWEGVGGGNHSILEVQIIFLPQTNILLQRISIVLGGPCYGWPPLQEKKREETAKIEMKVRKKKLRFLFLVILIFLFKYDETIFKFY